ncbi:MAG: DUF1080 domain-containing protein [Planctomycetota bacterium]
MPLPQSVRLGFAAALAAASLIVGPHEARSETGEWSRPFTAPPSASWIEAGDAGLAPSNPRRLEPVAGRGVLMSFYRGEYDDRNLLSDENYGDCEVHLEFMLSKGSNAGVKMHGLYEIQLRDSHGIAKPKATDCGGVYPRAELKPRYRTIDEGTPPLVNAARPAGEWQTLEIRFRTPRFDESGTKTASAVFEEVRLNGQVVQRGAVVDYPTGANWRKLQSPVGPLFLQGDHGPVAYRNVRIRALPAADGD